MNKIMDKIIDRSDDVLTFILGVMLILTFANVVARYVFLSSVPFIEEVTVAGMVVLTYAGSASNAKKGSHITLTILYDRVSPLAQRIFDLIGYCIGLFFAIVLLYRGILMVQLQQKVGAISITMGWPQWIFGMWLPIGGALMTIVYIQMILSTIHKLATWKKQPVEPALPTEEPKPEISAEGGDEV
ncbi:MAG: TRAP transporter small permease [Oscillospiraceae bacterium]|nr:TRAP transporter small permease [Oscillospiraceae bacterium]